MGSASPVMPSGEPCWDTALGSDTSTKASPQATVGPVCSALLCMESALGGMKAMSSVLNNKPPGCRDPRQGSVWPPIKTLEPGVWGWQIVRPTSTPSATQPYQPCVWVGPSSACSSVLCSAPVDLTAVTEKGYSLSASLRTHTMTLLAPPVSPTSSYALRPTDKVEKRSWQCHSPATCISRYICTHRRLFCAPK